MTIFVKPNFECAGAAEDWLGLLVHSFLYFLIRNEYEEPGVGTGLGAR